MSDSKPLFFAYVVVSHGPRHFPGRTAERPGARLQMDRITRAAARRGVFARGILHDYARNPTGPESFPALFRGLEQMEKHGVELLILQETERLFQKLPLKERERMLLALQPFHRVILDARRQRLLSELDHGQWVDVSAAGLARPAAGPREPLSEKEARWQTQSARRVSKRIRAAKADNFARQIRALRDELIAAEKFAGNRALAREANARGLRTTRGKEWSDVAIGRALKRLADGGTE